MTLYDLNKQGYLTLPDMSTEDISNAKKKLTNLIDEIRSSYYMLLCKERSDYTVFSIYFDYKDSTSMATEEIFSIVESRGKIRGVEFNDDETIDFWVLIDEEVFMYKLFDYEWGVIEVG